MCWQPSLLWLIMYVSAIRFSLKTENGETLCVRTSYLSFNIRLFYFQLLFSWQLYCWPPSNSAQLINAGIFTSQKRFAFTNTNTAPDFSTSMSPCNIKRARKLTFSVHTRWFAAAGGLLFCLHVNSRLKIRITWDLWLFASPEIKFKYLSDWLPCAYGTPLLLWLSAEHEIGKGIFSLHVIVAVSRSL